MTGVSGSRRYLFSSAIYCLFARYILSAINYEKDRLRGVNTEMILDPDVEGTRSAQQNQGKEQDHHVTLMGVCQFLNIASLYR